MVKKLSKKDIEIISLIKRRRGQVLVHSYLYYELDSPIWDDYKFDVAARELQKLQAEHKKLLPLITYEKENFEKWQSSGGTSGYNLVYSDAIIGLAYSLIRGVNGHKEVGIAETRKTGSQKVKGKVTAKQRRDAIQKGRLVDGGLFG